MNKCDQCGAAIDTDSPCDWFCGEWCQNAWNHARVGAHYDDPRGWWGSGPGMWPLRGSGYDC